MRPGNAEVISGGKAVAGAEPPAGRPWRGTTPPNEGMDDRTLREKAVLRIRCSGSGTAPNAACSGVAVLPVVLPLTACGDAK